MNRNANVFESLTNPADGQSSSALYKKPLKRAWHLLRTIGMGPRCGR